jgi:hypothetical protein
MNLHNLATVITPNLFRPFELTANDLIFAQHLVETFKIMMTHYKVIFDVASGGNLNEDEESVSTNSSKNKGQERGAEGKITSE